MDFVVKSKKVLEEINAYIYVVSFENGSTAHDAEIRSKLNIQSIRLSEASYEHLLSTSIETNWMPSIRKLAN